LTSKSNNESVIPTHYQQDGQDLLSHLEHIFPEDQMRGAYRFNIMKYATRAGRKDDIALEIDKIIEYAKRWKKFEESKKNTSPIQKDSVQPKEDCSDFRHVMTLTGEYGREIPLIFDDLTQGDEVYQLILDGSPVSINDKGSIDIIGTAAYYSKEQMVAFFEKNGNRKLMNLEVVAKKL